ncbi:MAG: FtsW/RodA/SpoVE family cell cycle protein [Bulleidia sp.]
MHNRTKIRLSHFFRLNSGSDIWILLCILLLAGFGLMMIGSASMGIYIGDSVHLVLTVVKQFVFLFLGYVMMCFASHHFHLYHLSSMKIVFAMILMECTLLFCRVFEPAGGAYAWIRIPVPKTEVTIQPSEFAKVLVMLVIAAYLGDCRTKKKNWKQLLAIPGITVLVYVFTILVIQKDLGSAAVLFVISCVCVLIPRHKNLNTFQWVLIVLFFGFLAFAVFLITPAGEKFIEALPLMTYQKNRFLSAINPFIDQYGDGYQLVNGLVAFASGGLFGVGFGNSIRKYTNFPAANTDFILAIVVEETGFLGFLFIMALYTFLIVRLFIYAVKIRSEKAKIILVGTAMYFMVHIFLNMGGVTGLIPLTGVPLPLFSAGGSSAMAMMLAVGLCQAVISAYKKGEIV